MSPAYQTALLFAVVQGATEFLPVSSSGHLLLLAILTGAGGGEPFFTVAMLHSATALAAVIYYRRACGQAARELWRAGPARRFLWRYALAQAATAAVALPLFFILTRTPAAQWRLSLWVIGVAMLVSAAVLLLAPRGGDGSGNSSGGGGGGAPAPGHGLPRPGWRAALWVGLAQGIAVLPGLSRAGLTIAAGRRAGLDGDAAAGFSFLLAPPVILAATLLWTIQTWPEPKSALADGQSAGAALAMGAVAFVIALGAIHWTASWTRAGRLWWFAPWNAALGAGALAVAAVAAI